MNFFYRLMAFAFVCLLPMITLAQELIQPGEPQDINEVVTLLGTVIKYFKEGQYLLGGAALTLILVFAFRKFVMPKMKLKAGVLPLISAVTGCLVGVSLAILAGATATQALLSVGAGPLASTLWDALIKYFFKKEA